MTLGAIKGKVAMVTDASSGSGLSVAQPFHEESAVVVMRARGAARLEKEAHNLGTWGRAHVFNVTRPRTQKMDMVCCRSF